MDFNRFFLLLALATASSGTTAAPTEGDSVIAGISTPVVTVFGEAKQVGSLDEQPFSFSKMERPLLRGVGAEGLKGLSRHAANLYIPDYGSRLTSAIYIRGVGSRIGSPAVGMQVDGVAYAEKSSFDFDFGDVERLEVLRGPQSTVYGRNAMGGLIRVYTFNPLSVRETGATTRVRLGGSTGDAGRHARVLRAGFAGSSGAYALSGFYSGSDGYNRNVCLGRRSNGAENFGGRFRYVSRPSRGNGLTADFQTSLQYSDEDGYDYCDVEDGTIKENEMGGYRRTLLNASLKLEQAWNRTVLTSVSAWQFLRDRMFMDQDFSPLDIFTLEQCQRSHLLSEELTLKSRRAERLEWMAGAYVSNQWLHTDAPVDFGADGVAKYIQGGMDEGLAKANAAMGAVGMDLGAEVTDKAVRIRGVFDTPVLNAAGFLHARIKDLLMSGLDLSAGLRLDYERNKLDYRSGTSLGFDFLMKRGGGTFLRKSFTTDTSYGGTVRKDYTQLLPSLALSYAWGGRENGDMIYLSVSKGFRAGGYNIQLFSDLVQSALRNDMMRTLSADPQLGSYMERYVEIADNPSADSATVYRPETSWNYELGTRFHLLDRRLRVGVSVFYMDIRDQQIARFSANGFGRQMVNAGRSESYGAEVELEASLRLFHNPLTVNVSYGYTHATFSDYDAGTQDGETYVYDGNHVPFAPLHSASLAAEYTVPMGNACLRFGVNATGLGRIYWTEDNSVSQPFYTLVGAHTVIAFSRFRLNLWGKNLSDTSYTPFEFVSMGKRYAQKCRPLQLGLDMELSF